VARQHRNQKSLLVRGIETLDEMACDGPTALLEVSDTEIGHSVFQSDFSGKVPPKDQSLTPEDCYAIFTRLLSGEDTTSFYYHLVCLNAGAGFYVAEKAASIEEGTAFAQELLSRHKVTETFELCRRAYGNLPV
jgi:anthranilate phosphoribosyltransferase